MAATGSKLYVYIVLLIASTGISQAVSRSPTRESLLIARHEQWMIHHARVYKNAIERENRFRIFKANVEYIDSFNSLPGKSYRLGINQFADQTNEEFMASHNTYTMISEKNKLVAPSFTYKNNTQVPLSTDWRKKGAVTPVRSETCGDWTFPAVDTVEGLTKIRTNKLYTLSVQEIVDCNDDGNRGCTGGFTYKAFEFIKQKGLTTKANYLSKATNGTCNTKKENQPVAKINGYEYVEANNEKALLQAVANQPVAVMIDAGEADFQFYSGGIFTGKCGTQLNQGVTVVGYGSSKDGLKYWIIKNSWTPSWGEEGYMRLQRDVGAKEGLCGIAMEASYPTA